MGRRRDRAALAAGLGFVLVVAGGAALAFHHSPTPRYGGFADDGPCGSPVALTEAVGRFSLPLLVPHAAAAGPLSLKETRWCDGAVLELYDSGLKIALQPNELADPSTTFERWATEYETVSTGTVLGQPAAFGDPAKDPSGTTKGAVTFVYQGEMVQVVGAGKIPLADLVDIANSLAPTTSQS